MKCLLCEVANVNEIERQPIDKRLCNNTREAKKACSSHLRQQHQQQKNSLQTINNRILNCANELMAIATVAMLRSFNSFFESLLLVLLLLLLFLLLSCPIPKKRCYLVVLFCFRLYSFTDINTQQIHTDTKVRRELSLQR